MWTPQNILLCCKQKLYDGKINEKIKQFKAEENNYDLVKKIL
jgi:hypothetical protein